MPAGRGGRDFIIALTPGAFTIFVAFHPVDLLAISIQVACSAGHSRLRSDGSPAVMFIRRLPKQSFLAGASIWLFAALAFRCSAFTIARASSVIVIHSG